jgi:DNA modification methylase
LVDNENILIAGHGRLEAAKLLGLANVPAMVIEGLSDAQKQALRLADNKLALNAGWDDDLLRTELMDLRDVGFDLGLTGFGDDELAAIFADHTTGLTDPDDVPEAPLEPVSRLGDVWLLGRHRLVCGDATSEVDVSLALAGVRPHLMVTDPPYGVDYDPAWRSDPSVAARIRHPKKGAVGEVANDHNADWRDAWLLFSGDVAYVWHAGNKAHVVAESLMAAGLEIRSQVVWAKHRFVIGRGHYHPQHEPCWYAVRNHGHWQGDRTQSTLWTIDAHQRSETGHSAQKPVECMRRPIENNSSPGQAVYDPFVGSGTTLIAAEMTGRSCHAIEISPAYCDVSVLRWQAFTGSIATRPDGTPFGAAHAETRQATAPAD